MQREEQPVMTTGLERIADKARCEPKLRFTSLAHHLTKERVWENLCQIPTKSAAGVDGQTVTEAKDSFEEWIAGMLQSVHRQGYRAPDIRRVYIPKPGKQEMRPLGVPTIADRALQRSASQVLSAIYEQDFLPCSFGGRPGRGAHQALATLHEKIAGGKIEWVLEADLKNFFGSLSHEWMLRFVEHRVGDQRLISLIRRWLKAGVLENGEVHPSEEGTPQGGSVSVLLSNIYLHYALDLWFERVVKPRLRGEACMVRYIDDFVLCFLNAVGSTTGIASHFGQFSFTYQLTATLANGTATGSGHLIAANGDSVYTTITGSADLTTPGLASITEIDTITGGTGRFAGAQGSFTVERLVVSATVSPPVRFTGRSLPRVRRTEPT